MFRVFSIISLIGWMVWLPIHALAADEAKIRETAAKLFPGAKVTLVEGQGRIDVDPAHRFSYFIFTPHSADAESTTFFIPLGTTRFNPDSYATDQWWRANREKIEAGRANGDAAIRQDPAEVAKYLESHNLSSNPLVYKITRNGLIPQHLQEFMLDYYHAKFYGGPVVLYRGAERAKEKSSWQQGEIPWGASYFTPNPLYAWRYTRKNPEVGYYKSGADHLLRFEMPYEQLEREVRAGNLILGVELPKSAHQAFDRNGVFLDGVLTDFFYLGDSTMAGLEPEVLAVPFRKGALVSAFAGSETPESLGRMAVDQLEEGTLRLVQQYPSRQEDILKILPARLGESPRWPYRYPNALLACIRAFRQVSETK